METGKIELPCQDCRNYKHQIDLLETEISYRRDREKKLNEDLGEAYSHLQEILLWKAEEEWKLRMIKKNGQTE